jgi:hypothetical protein
VGDNEISDDKNDDKLLAISIAMAMASPNRAQLGLHCKPLDAAIGQVPAPYCPGGCHGQRIC